MTANDRANLEIFEDFAFQRRTWRVERIGWVALALFLVAALLGAFGGGILGSASAGSADGRLSMRYDRFWRQQSPMELRLNAVPPAEGSRLRIWISREYIERINISQVTPVPRSVEIAADRMVLEFTVAEGRGAVPIMLRVEPLRPWRATGRIGLEDGPALTFRHFIYP